MSPELAKKLIQKGIIRHNTEIDAFYKGIDIGGAAISRVQGNFTVTSVNEVRGDVVFKVRDTRDGSPRQVNCSDVFLVDGMEPSRFAGIYGLSEEGVAIKQGKRRGRKPKIRESVEA